MKNEINVQGSQKNNCKCLTDCGVLASNNLTIIIIMIMMIVVSVVLASGLRVNPMLEELIGRVSLKLGWRL